MHVRIGDRAVVLGASLAGLLAARVLADAYRQVTVIDRDQLPETPTHRRGVPHGRHIHALLARGQQALEELVPGLTAELVNDGIPTGDLLANARLYLSGHRLRQAHTGLGLLCVSRPVLEGHVRTRVRALANVRFLDSCDVVGLATTPDTRRVTGARVLRRADGSAEELVAGAASPPGARHRAAATLVLPRPRPRGGRALGHRGRRRPGLPRRPGPSNPQAPAGQRLPDPAPCRRRPRRQPRQRLRPGRWPRRATPVATASRRRHSRTAGRYAFTLWSCAGGRLQAWAQCWARSWSSARSRASTLARISRSSWPGATSTA